MMSEGVSPVNERIRAMCTVDLPYPVAAVPVCCLDDACLLAFSYAGAGGELGCALQYRYAALVTADEKPRTLTQVFACIAETELCHLRLLGEQIVALGGIPKYRTPEGSAGALCGIDYRLSPVWLLHTACEAERAELSSYRRMLPILRDESTKRLVERIIMDEEKHLSVFGILKTEIGG